jgi:hypothetical protein
VNDTPLGSSDPRTEPVFAMNENNEITFDWGRPLFGEQNEAKFSDDEIDESDYGLEESPTPHTVNVIEASPDCGICYRSGFVPGFEQWGKHRIVLTSHDLSNEFSYFIDREQQPHTFNRMHGSGFVEFEVSIPRYFKGANVSVRNNYDILAELPTVNGQPLTLSLLQMLAGSKVAVRIVAEQFTHVVLVFDLGTEPVLANIAQLSKQTDWTTFEAIGNLQAILPMTIEEVTVGSIMIVPNMNLGLRIVDVTYLRTARSFNVDWSVNTRVAQPQEPWRHIHKATRLY